MKKIISVFFFLFLCIMAYSQNEQLTVDISGFRNDKGVCYVSLYNSQDGFPTDSAKAYRKLVLHIKDMKSKAVFKDLDPGVYAVVVVHDENNNGKTDTNFLGIPKEGLGSSNNPRTMGPPRFNDTKFLIGEEDSTIEIKIKYIL
jgi:uncharacterized protein (DUF2141 family)